MVIRLKRKYLIAAAACLSVLFVLGVLIRTAGLASETSARPAAAAQGRELPVIMYHQLTDTAAQAGEYVLTARQFEADMRYICSRGYTSVTTQQLIDYAHGRAELPEKPILITFDDGYESFIPYALPILEELNMYAVVSVIGSVAQTYTDTVDHNIKNSHLSWEAIAQLAANPHVEIGNHTYSHKYLNKLNTAQIRQEIDRCADTVQSVCGVRPATVRLPGGNKNATVLAAVQEPIVLWNVDTLDWKTRNAQQTVSAVLDHVQDGDIILMHELYQASGDAALQIIPELTNRGYQLVTVSEMAQYRRGGLQNGQIYYSMKPQ